jgi:hypothetical protein
VPKNLLLDSSFWYALYNVRDPFYEQANACAKYLDFYTNVFKSYYIANLKEAFTYDRVTT